MQPTLRSFSLLGFLVVVLTAGGVGYYCRNYVIDHLIVPVAERANQSVAASFVQSVWAPATGKMARPLCQQEAAIPNCPDLNLIRSQGSFFFTSLPLVLLNVYNLDGQQLLLVGGSFADKNILENGLPDFARARDGIANSKLLRGVDYSDPQGAAREGYILRSFIPITIGDHITEVIEVAYDVTPYWDSPLHLQLIGTGTILLIFGVIYLVQRLRAAKSESIIVSQHEEQADLVAARAKAEEDSVEKSKFLANVSHELRTPLNSIIGFSEILKDEVMGPLGMPQYKEYATDIHASGTHLLSLINDILDFSKADAGKLEVQIEEVDVTKLMKNCVRLIAQRAESMHIKLLSEFTDEHIVARTDAKRLKQVVLNLLTNSVKFTPPGGTVRLICKVDTLNGYLKIAVEDTGVGIAEKDISKVMAAFGQVKNEYSSKSEGTGLGLPLTKKLVELMGGQFAITSQLGSGTQIALTFPYRPVIRPSTENLKS